MAIQSRSIMSGDQLLNEQSADGSKTVAVNFSGGPVVVATDAGAAADLWDAIEEAKALCDEPGASVRVTYDDVGNAIQSITVTRTHP